MLEPWTERIWLMGLAPAAERFVAAIPPERRAAWDRIVVAEADEGRVRVVFRRGQRYVQVPVAVELLSGSTPEGFAAHVEQTAERYAAACDAEP